MIKIWNFYTSRSLLICVKSKPVLMFHLQVEARKPEPAARRSSLYSPFLFPLQAAAAGMEELLCLECSIFLPQHIDLYATLGIFFPTIYCFNSINLGESSRNRKSNLN